MHLRANSMRTHYSKQYELKMSYQKQANRAKLQFQLEIFEKVAKQFFDIYQKSSEQHRTGQKISLQCEGFHFWERSPLTNLIIGYYLFCTDSYWATILTENALKIRYNANIMIEVFCDSYMSKFRKLMSATQSFYWIIHKIW